MDPREDHRAFGLHSTDLADYLGTASYRLGARQVLAEHPINGGRNYIDEMHPDLSPARPPVVSVVADEGFSNGHRGGWPPPFVAKNARVLGLGAPSGAADLGV